jgi:RecJ-like exonuclease
MKNKTILLISALLIFSVNCLIGQTKVYSVEELIENAPKLVGQTVTAKGKAQHVCAQSGRKIFLLSTDGKKTLRFNAGKEIDKFDKNAIGKTVTITGVVFEQKVTLENLEKQEVAAKQAELEKKAEEHCSSEAKADGQDVQQTPLKRIQVQIEKLKAQIAKGGNPYLSYYSVYKVNTYTFE